MSSGEGEVLLELRFHGRGGQGAVKAAEVLVDAAILEGKYGQAFPFFGAERRGAPVEAYARISDKPIRIHSGIRTPDIVIVLDPSLLRLVNVLRGLKPGGKIIINSPKKVEIEGDYEVYVVNATKIALDLKLVVAGWAIVNTAMLGALVKATNIVSLDSTLKAIRHTWAGDLGVRNAKAVERAYHEVIKVK